MTCLLTWGLITPPPQRKKTQHNLIVNNYHPPPSKERKKNYSNLFPTAFPTVWILDCIICQNALGNFVKVHRIVRILQINITPELLVPCHRGWEWSHSRGYAPLSLFAKKNKTKPCYIYMNWNIHTLHTVVHKCLVCQTCSMLWNFYMWDDCYYHYRREREGKREREREGEESHVIQ